MPALKPPGRYQYTAKKVVDFEASYTLTHADGTWAPAEAERNTLVSLWPAAVYAELNAVGSWQGCLPRMLTLEELMSTRTVSFGENGFLVNVFSINGKTGFVVNPD